MSQIFTIPDISGNVHVFSLFRPRTETHSRKVQLPVWIRPLEQNNYMDRKDFAMNATASTLRLETPKASGYRSGMSSSSMIARKLERIYSLPSDMPREMGEILQLIDRKTLREG